MLTRNSQLADPQKFYNDAMNETPSVKDSVFDNFNAGVATPVVALNELDEDFSKKPEGQAITDSLGAIEQESHAPGIGWGQWLADTGANLLGYAINPVTWVGGGAGEAIGEVASKAIGSAATRIAPGLSSMARQPLSEVLNKNVAQYIPSTIGSEEGAKTLSTGLLGEDAVKNFGAGFGAMVPQSITDNYNQDTGHIEWGGVAREATEMGGLGIAIGTIPYGWGILKGRINRKIDEPPEAEVTKEKLDVALEQGHITPEEHKLGHDYLDHLKNPQDTETTDEIQRRFTELIIRNGQTANSVTNEALFDILKPEDVSTIHNVIADQLASNHLDETQRKSLSDYIIKNRLDYIRKNPESLDGLRGYVAHVDSKIAQRDLKTSRSEDILDKYLEKGAKDNLPFSQKAIAKYIKQSQFESSHVENLPINIPDNILSNMKVQEKMSTLRSKLTKDRRRGLPENKQTLRRLDELNDRIKKVETPREELNGLRQRLLDGGLKPGFRDSKDYHRLLDLSNVWHNAKTLADRVHMEDQYNRQEAFSTLAKQIIGITDSDAPALANPDNIMSYLKARMEGTSYTPEPVEKFNQDVADHQTVPEDAETIIDQNISRSESSQAHGAEESKKLLEASSEKFKEFKNNTGVFKNLIECVMGAINA